MAGIVPPWGQVLGNLAVYLVFPRTGQRQCVPRPQLPRESGHLYSLNDELENFNQAVLTIELRDQFETEVSQ